MSALLGVGMRGLRGAVVVMLAVLLFGVAPTALASGGQWFRGRSGTTPAIDYENLPYNGAFTFARIRFEPSRWGPGRYQWGLDLKWNHDYPRADRRLAEILGLVTGVDANQGGSNIVGLDEPELFDYPWAYMCEVGFLTLTPEEAENLRNYMLKGGFVVIDDFTGNHWYNFEAEMRKVFPELRLMDIDESHPVFHAFFEIADLSFGGGQYAGTGFGRNAAWPRYYALFEDNDPNKRLMMIVNFDNDVGEYWEFAQSRYVEIDLSNDAFKLGVNYVMYSMLH